VIETPVPGQDHPGGSGLSEVLTGQGGAPASDSPSPSAGAPRPRIEVIVAEHFDAVWRSLRRLGVPDGSVDDAAQQVFLVAARKVETILPGGEKAYVMGVAVRVASDARRTQSRRREVMGDDLEHEDASPSVEDLVDQKRARDLLDRTLAAMPMDLRAAFTMFEIEGMSVPEVADALGIPLGTASSRLRRAREQFHAIAHRLVSPRGGARV
jgi:RNA polymerase sigma-70 factor, ECF subfamily